MAFKIGDKVRFIGGDQVMTVVGFSAGDSVDCRHTTCSSRVLNESWPATSLERAPYVAGIDYVTAIDAARAAEPVGFDARIAKATADYEAKVEKTNAEYGAKIAAEARRLTRVRAKLFAGVVAALAVAGGVAVGLVRAGH